MGLTNESMTWKKFWGANLEGKYGSEQPVMVLITIEQAAPMDEATLHHLLRRCAEFEDIIVLFDDPSKNRGYKK